MSLDIVRAENSRHPEHLRENVNATCYTYLSHVIDLLRQGGHQAYFVCKTAGEGQYTPPGWVPFTGPGLDGKPYTYTGVSHDALWCDGKQFDTAARANDSPDPIFNADGSRMTAEPVWNEIPQQHWRPQNPPLKDSAPIPEPQPPSVVVFPPRNETMAAFDACNMHYRAKGRPARDPQNPNSSTRLYMDNEGLSVWEQQYLLYRVNGKGHPEAVDRVLKDIDAAWS